MLHILERTSPKGEDFIGKCALCGEEEVSLYGYMDEHCPAKVTKKQVDEAIVKSIIGES